jgi:hypothetical protein
MARETDLCEEFGCVIGCIASYRGHGIYVVREKDSIDRVFLKDEDTFLFCPDCGSEAQGVIIAQPQHQLKELARQIKEIRFAPDC